NHCVRPSIVLLARRPARAFGLWAMHAENSGIDPSSNATEARQGVSTGCLTAKRLVACRGCSIGTRCSRGILGVYQPGFPGEAVRPGLGGSECGEDATRCADGRKQADG